MSEGASSIVTQPAATFASSQLSFETQTLSIAAAAAATSPVDPPPDVPLPVVPVDPPPEPVASEPVASEPVASNDEPPDDNVIMLMTELEPEVSEPFDAPASEEADPPPAELDSDTEIYTLSSESAVTAAADPPDPSDPADECLATPSFAEAVDVVLMGPFTPEQFAAQPANAIFRLQDLIALLAVDVADRRRVATVFNQTCE
jgi:nicotinate-nucleotide--dimethylbenzimidazole phosphoribosyltransferase